MSGRRGPVSAPLVCPSCGTPHPPTDRFCEDCRVPLVHDRTAVVPPPEDERHARARKIKPQLAEGQLVRAAWARNQAEGEFIQGLLLEEGIPSILRRSAGFDVPDMLAAGPRDVLVPESGLPAARDVLMQAEIIGSEPETSGRPASPGRLLLGLLAAVAVGALLIWLITAVSH